MMDTHIYQMFSNDVRPMLKGLFFCFDVDRLCITIPQLVALSNSAHISTACDHAQDLSTFDLWVVVGEWTPAATDCGVYKLSANAG
jgi:glucan 1,3-beta-glucosidase